MEGGKSLFYLAQGADYVAVLEHVADHLFAAVFAV